MCAVSTRSVRRRSMAGSRSMAGWSPGDSSVAQSVENTESECRPTPVPSSDRHILKDAIAKYKGGRAATLAFCSAPEPPSDPSTHVRDACQPTPAAWSLLHVHAAGARLTSTKDVLDHRLKCFGEGDLEGVLADYSPDAVLFM